MSWSTFHDGWDENPKVQAVSDAAVIMWLRAVTYCNRNRTDGFVPWSKVPELTRSPRRARKLATELLDVRVPGCKGGLFDPDPDDRGIWVHDFLVHNWSRSKIETRRSAQSEGGRRGAEAKWGAAPKRSTPGTRSSHERATNRTRSWHESGTIVAENCHESATNEARVDGSQLELVSGNKAASDQAADGVTHKPSHTDTHDDADGSRARAFPFPSPIPIPETPPGRADAGAPPAEAAVHQQVVEAWFAAFRRSRGVEPTFNGRDGKSVKTLIATFRGDVAAISRLFDAAFSDRRWASQRATLSDLASNPNQFLGRAQSPRPSDPPQPSSGSRERDYVLPEELP